MQIQTYQYLPAGTYPQGTATTLVPSYAVTHIAWFWSAWYFTYLH